VRKVVPDADTLEHHARRLYAQQLTAAVLEHPRVKIDEQAASAALPEDLELWVREEIDRQPHPPVGPRACSSSSAWSRARELNPIRHRTPARPLQGR
jgi:hypothetical protein